jgi:Ca-activated chloride channel family protein
MNMSPVSVRQLIVLVALSAIPLSVSGQSVERIVYASVLNRAGRPVTDVTARDLTVRENNIDRRVLRVYRAIEPLDVAVLVDTSQDAEVVLPEFRRGLVDFVRAMGDRHEIAVFGFGQRPIVLVDFTREGRLLEAGIARLAPRRGSGAYLMDGIVDVSRRLRNREHSRRELVVVTSDSGEFSGYQSEDAIGAVQDSAIVFDAFVVMGTPNVGPAYEAGIPGRSVPASAQEQPDIERAVALAEATKRTGGRREVLGAGALGTKLRELAVRLNNQYAVVYGGPPRITPPASIEIVTTRPDMRVRVMGTPQNQP